MKIVIDSAVPFVKGVFEPFCSVEYVDGGSITPDVVKDATALLIRTRTRCDEALLRGSAVKHIATATIGFDHIDIPYCRANNIEVSTAAGCNARAVLQWFSAVMVHLSRTEGWQPSQRCVGVVGVGNVGGLVSRYAKLWGFNVVCCDPPREEREKCGFVDFEQLAAQADIITFHTPLDASTHHMLCSETLRLMSPNTTILNSSRGEVVCTQDLLDSGNRFVMDVWEHEPHINLEALQRALLATPHIAGYSLQGKANAAMMAVQSIAKALDLPLQEWSSDTPKAIPTDISWQQLTQTIGGKFNIEEQSNYLKSHVELFEQIRNSYNYREEYF